MTKKKILIVFGTRPEAIKLAPLIYELKKNTSQFETTICVTGQHREMLDQVLHFFNIQPDIDLKLMTHNQSLAELNAKILIEIDNLLKNNSFDYVIIQGDTTTVYSSAVAAFYNKVKIIHIEAGLRSYDFEHPFPEEFNRRSISSFTDFNFVPSKLAEQNLLKENISKTKIWNVGNTVIDALKFTLDVVSKEENTFYQSFKEINFDKQIILVTGHRRENFGDPLQNICEAFIEITDNHEDVQVVYPVHLNPNVQGIVQSMLKDKKNIILIPPLPYQQMIWLMNKSSFIITDSGGIQEEAPALGKPVLVTRETTERKEVVESGNAIMVGYDKEKIIQYSKLLIENKEFYNKMSSSSNPYGNGTTAKQIVKILTQYDK